MSHCLRDRLALRDVDVLRLTREFRSEALHFRRERCREQQRLSRARHRRQHAAQRWEKTHIQHPVGFIEREDFHVRQID